MAYQLSSYNTLLSVLYVLEYIGVLDKSQCKRALLKLKRLENSSPNLTEFAGELNKFRSECFARETQNIIK